MAEQLRLVFGWFWVVPGWAEFGVEWSHLSGSVYGVSLVRCAIYMQCIGTKSFWVRGE